MTYSRTGEVLGGSNLFQSELNLGQCQVDVTLPHYYIGGSQGSASVRMTIGNPGNFDPQKFQIVLAHVLQADITTKGILFPFLLA